MAKHGMKYPDTYSGKGKDCGAHEAFQKASSPASVKTAAGGKTPYKHR